ncbi:hypothetical protein, partial [Pseudomonas fluorescens]|uniref:hypothetical protein n=1 Tax=Pseudomonas fluorescens TaxID=294 RepID=UPI001F42CE1D
RLPQPNIKKGYSKEWPFLYPVKKVLLKQWHGIFHETLLGLLSPSHCTSDSMLKRYPLRPMAAVAAPGVPR